MLDDVSLESKNTCFEFCCRVLRMFTPSTSRFCSKSWKALSKDDWEMWTTHLLGITFNKEGLLLSNIISSL